MEPIIVTEPEWLIVGMSFYGDPFSQASGWDEDNEIGLLWKRFMAFCQRNPTALKHVVTPAEMLEIHVETDETAEKGVFEVFVGVRVSKLEDVPVELSVKVLPATQYARFTLQGEQIVSDWSMMMLDWLAESGYERAYRYGIDYYDSRFKGVDNIADSELDAYVPIKPAR